MVGVSDVKVYATTNNLGGAITGTQVISANPNNVFTNVPNNERVIGEDYYACVYFKNGHSTESMENFKLWLSSKTPPPDTELKWGFDSSATGSGYRWSPAFTSNGSNNDTTSDSAALDLNTFSISCWFKTSGAYTQEGMIANKGGIGSDTAGQNMNYGLWLTQTNAFLRGGFETGAGADNFVTSSIAVNDNVRHWAMVTYDGSELALYLDDPVTPIDTLATSATPETNALDFKINENSRSVSRWLNSGSEIDEVYVWNRGLTDVDERTAVFEDNIVNSTGLVIEKHFGTDDLQIVAQTISDKYTSPINIDWLELGSQPDSPNVGNLSAGEAFPIWLWLHVNANAVSRIDDGALFTFNFEIPQGGTGSGGGTCEQGTYHYEPYAIMPDDVDIVSSTAALELDHFSLACWFRTSKDYTEDLAGYMITKGLFLGSPGNNINYGLLISTDVTGYNALEVVFDTPSANGSGHYSVFSDVAVNDGQWHHGCGTYDGSTLKLYLDGQRVSSDDDFNTTGGDAPDTGTQELVIGGHEGFLTYEGNEDEVRIWNVALTDQEVSDLYNNGDVPQTSAIVYENLFGGSGSSCGGSGGSGGNPPPTPTDYKIAFAGDWGCESATDDVISLIQDQDYDYVVGVGDNAYASSSCWTNRFSVLKPNFNSAYGNHEYEESGGITPYKTFFGHSLTYFTFQYQNIFFLVIDTNISLGSGSAQHNFITNELARVANDSTIKWKIAVMHHPWFGADSDHSYNDDNQVQAYHTLFVNNGVNFVVVGHNHNWQRTHQVAYNSSDPESPTVVDNTSPYSKTAAGLIHVVTGTGGHDSGSGLYALGSQPSFQAYQNRTHNGIWSIEASNNGNTLTCAFVSIDGDRFDEFTIS
jgi:hypothetical protein